MASRSAEKPRWRILLVARQFVPLVGGTERQAERLARSLAGRGARVTVLTTHLDPRSPAREKRDGFECIRIDVPRLRFIGTLLWGWRLFREIARRAPVTDVVHVFWAKESALTALLAARVNNLPVVIRPAGAGRFGDAHAARGSILKRLIFACLRGADAYVALSTTIRDELLALGVPPARLYVIPNGIPIGRREPWTRRPMRAVFVGRLTEAKNLETLLHAWRIVADALPDASLEIVGDGPLARRLGELARELGVCDSVSFPGNVSDVSARLTRARVFVQPSISEGMSAALLEALAAGLPAVVTRTSGALDLVEEDVSGKFVPHDDPRAIADALVELLADEDKARSFGQRARKSVSERCDIDVVVDRHLDLYARLVRRFPVRRASRCVLMIIATLDNAGAENQMALLAEGLVSRGRPVEVACLTRTGPLEERLGRARVPVHLLRKRGKLDLRTFGRLLGLVRRRRDGIVHTWLFTSNSYGRFAALLARARCVVASERSLDPWKGATAKLIDRTLARATGAIVANARAVRETLLARGIDPQRIRVIPNAFFLPAPRRADVGALRARLVPVDEPVIGCVGRLSAEKGLDILLSAFAEVVSSRGRGVLLVVGKGPERSALELLAAERHIRDRVFFAGEVMNVADYYACMDLLALPSRYEGLPNVLIEAGASGLAVVAADVGGVREVVQDGKTGLIVPPDDPGALACAIGRLLDDKALRASLGRAAKRVAVERFSVDTMVNTYEELYRDLSKEKP